MVMQESLARLVRRDRRDAELTQKGLAKRAGLSVQALRDIEQGSQHRPRRDTRELLCAALAVPAEEHAALLTVAAQVASQDELVAEVADAAVTAYLQVLL
jgi:transcriptional regulator with XRE-family HTH domain